MGRGRRRDWGTSTPAREAGRRKGAEGGCGSKSRVARDPRLQLFVGEVLAELLGDSPHVAQRDLTRRILRGARRRARGRSGNVTASAWAVCSARPRARVRGCAPGWWHDAHLVEELEGLAQLLLGVARRDLLRHDLDELAVPDAPVPGACKAVKRWSVCRSGAGVLVSARLAAHRAGSCCSMSWITSAFFTSKPSERMHTW